MRRAAEQHLGEKALGTGVKFPANAVPPEVTCGVPWYSRAMSPNRIELVCFDLGGVVVRTCRTWREACGVAGVDYREEAEEPARRRAFAEVVRRYETGQLDRTAYRAAGAAALGDVHTKTELGRIHDAWIRGEIDGVAELVEGLAARSGLQTGCLSNTNERHWELMCRDSRAYAAFHRLGFRWSSHLLGVMKPSPEIYAAYATRCAVEPGTVLFFDDLAENVAASGGAGGTGVRSERAGAGAEQIQAGLRGAGVSI